MRSAAFTLVEVTLSIALLAGIAMGAVALVTTVSRNEQSVREAEQWRRAAGEVIARIRDDLRIGDFDIASADQEKKPRVRVSEGCIEIDTRSRTAGPGAVLARYSAANGELIRTEHVFGKTKSRVLMLSTSIVATFDADRGVLFVTLIGPKSLRTEHWECIP